MECSGWKSGEGEIKLESQSVTMRLKNIEYITKIIANRATSIHEDIERRMQIWNHKEWCDKLMEADKIESEMKIFYEKEWRREVKDMGELYIVELEKENHSLKQKNKHLWAEIREVESKLRALASPMDALRDFTRNFINFADAQKRDIPKEEEIEIGH